MTKFAETVNSEQPSKVSSIQEGKFDAQLAVYANGEKGILKTRPFANDFFRGIPKQELPRREVATYLLDAHVLDFGVVPETVLTKYKGREASVQKWVVTGMQPRDVVPGLFDKKQSDWKQKLAKFFFRSNLDDLQKIVLLDLVVNNVDRHGRNILADPTQKKVWAIDNGLSFGRYYKGYRSVFHKYLYYARLPMPEWATKKLARIKREDLDVLRPLLPAACVDDTWLRIQFVLDHSDRLAYRRMGAPKLGTDKFPSYEEWFHRQERAVSKGIALVLQSDVDATSLRAVQLRLEDPS